MSDAKRFKNDGCSLGLLGLRQMCEAVLDVLLDRQVRKQRKALKHVSDAPFGHGKISTLRNVEQDAVADGDVVPSRAWLIRRRNPTQLSCPLPMGRTGW